MVEQRVTSQEMDGRRQAMARYVTTFSSAGDGAHMPHGPGDRQAQSMLVGALLGFGAFFAGFAMVGFGAGVLAGLALGAVGWMIGRWQARRLSVREAQEAAEARAIQDAETERQLAEMKAHGGQKEDGGDRTSR
ncbi:MAG: hypothetical protein AAFR79_03555 [Pseudomonadota bacterium]